ncbi:hypothetical protein E4T42_00626 [Aureobasidium subglaciale]|uniref:C3H1-type domain-containing protein n=1 Tax=Aureobasidium subglaciale (strain EXF-2481) TaxID=1043005 RepID=A0A074ZJX3_AURSE|nr:uncharacterized protein AUEXF2481DRAFT_1611 [Aureobasidium subglaciale EXF-2481]KAI5203717.1 hypothetical protein E4T38_04927 [Aureobasidium subglaciale]KAI5222277.1 hypothetical protein E4T40_04965 [Aureobasidium subglaciale]KAI5226322.1 hypothetical protein E4T41_04784 [Aureobasidium subglaciale]KAI5258790.1 hypothetical protein E4T42_00626 [Aureobasidium subglaciale]KAI5262019.1 hypothetical protein E4T46_04677 [Aureobasidium subglaciale]
MPGLHMSTYATPGPLAWSAPRYPAVVTPQQMMAPGFKFFIERDNGSLIPLLPVDELPDEVRLVGVPLSLTDSQARAQGMVYLGHQPSTRDKFIFAGTIKDSVAPSSITMKYTPQLDTALYNTNVPQQVHVQPVTIPTPVSVQSSRPPIPPKSKPLYNERPLPPSGIEPDQRKKVYCTYWIQNQGQCAYMQQGCMYRHEMPEDKKTLNSIGLKSVPLWWRQQQARNKKQKAVRVPPSHSTDAQLVRQAVQDSRSNPVLQKTLVVSDAPTDLAPVSTSPIDSSSPGGVRLGAAKTPVRGPSSLPFRKQTLESPIEENLIEFDVLLPSSSSDNSLLSQLDVEALTSQRSKAEAMSRRSKVVINDSLLLSSGGSTVNRQINSGRHRRDSADREAGIVTPPGQCNNAVNGRSEKGRERVGHRNGVSRRGRVKIAPITEGYRQGHR